MNLLAKKYLHKIFLSVSANLTTMFVSFVFVLIVPKLLGIVEYGYWQLYTFYIGYVGFFHFGLADGIYLQYGGEYYDNLDKPLMHSQYWVLTVFELTVFLLILLFTFFFVHDSNRSFILIFSGLNCVILLPRLVLQNLLQGTGKVKEYARNIIFERLACVILVLGIIVFGDRKYQYILIADVVAKLLALFNIAWICRDIVFSKGTTLNLAFRESKDNISIGIKLMFANIAGFLIIGVVRFAIERIWDIAAFGKVSFSLSISNFILTFILAISIVIFPIIKRTDQNKLSVLYETFGSLLSKIMIIFLLFFFPIQLILLIWLPEYVDAINYLSILFPICVFESRTYLLINTYMKALRKEKAMLWLNVLTVFLSILLTLITVVILKSITLAILSIVLLMAFKCVISDLYLQKQMNMMYKSDVVWDSIAITVFIFTHWALGGIQGWLLYGLYVCVFSIFTIQKTKSLYFQLKGLII